MALIKINGQEYEVANGTTVLRAALDRGIFIPHFCYHPYLVIAGNCRMCLVDIKPGPPGKLQIACNTVVADKMEVDTRTAQVARAQRDVMQFLLKNHPVDCPICDQAGECWLQHYYMDYDLKPARILGQEEKVKKHKAMRPGKTMTLDSERCILCTRCIRFMRDVAGDDCITVKERRDHSEITLFPGKVLDSPYSMNLADVCPVGAWTSADFRFRQRVWFLTATPSICPMCARGCNIVIEQRRNEVYRMRPRVNDAVNKCWMCDMGRMSYHAINDERLLEPELKDRGQVGWDEALEAAAKAVKAAGDKLVAVVYASLSQEEGRKALALFRDQLHAKVVLHVGDPGPEDQLLRKADQNANTRGLSELGIIDRLGTDLPEGAVIVSLETLCSHPLPPGLPAPAVVVSPTRSLAAKAAAVALPSASWAETAGTFVNFDGAAQTYSPAIDLKGQARPMVDALDQLAAKLGMKL